MTSQEQVSLPLRQHIACIKHHIRRRHRHRAQIVNRHFGARLGSESCPNGFSAAHTAAGNIRVLDGRDTAADEVIALVYYHLPPDGDLGESNLARSIASKVRGLDYLSKYDPLEDLDVRRYLPTVGPNR